MIVEHAYAKLNLALDVVGKRKDGFHHLNMIVMPLQLADVLTFEASDDIVLNCDENIPNNVVYQTAKLMQQTFNIQQGVAITLKKHIPIGSGLGGESADIAATIRGLNRFWQLNLSQETLEEIALSLGSDTLFCLYNQTAYVSGRGEHLQFLDVPPIKHIYLCISEYPISTKDAFALYQPNKKDISFEQLLESYQNKQYEWFFKQTYNDLLETAYLLDKTLKNTYFRLLKRYEIAYMTGSGSTLFLIENHEKKLNIDEIKTISRRKVLKTAPFR